jgi:transcriptional regulator with XRE-family HTH domain
MVDKKVVYDRLRSHLSEDGLSLNEVSKRIGISYPTMLKFVRSDGITYLSTLFKIERYLDSLTKES